MSRPRTVESPRIWRRSSRGLTALTLLIAGLFVVSVPLGATGAPADAAPSAGGPSVVPAQTPEPSAGSGAQWPMYMADIEHTAYQADAEDLNASSVPHLQMLWNYTTGGDVVSEPAVVNNSVYFGSWDGYEYSVYANNGTLRWRTFTGQSTCAIASHPDGVTSSAAVVNGTVYFGGGGAYWEALSAANGSILWQIYTGNNSPSAGHYNWASPLIVNGYAYVGLASQCGNPQIQGGLLKVDLATHAVVGRFNTTIPSHPGASIWSSPAYDPATGKVFFGTGNDIAGQGTNTTLDDSIVSLNASTMKIVGHFQVPYVVRIPDGDFGGSVTLYTSDNGTPMVGEQDKDGYFFAVARNHLGAGAVWDLQIANAITSSCAAYRDGTLYIASTATTLNGVNVSGSVRAVNASTGAVLWAQPLAGPAYGSVVALGKNLVLAAGGNELAIFQGTTGKLLWNWSAPIRFFGGPTVADGRIYIGDNNGLIYAFGLPLDARATGNPLSGIHPLSVSFHVDAWGGGQGYSYLWNFGDHTTGTSASPVHTYKKAGTYSVTVTVTDRNGATIAVPLTVTVSEPRPSRRVG